MSSRDAPDPPGSGLPPTARAPVNAAARKLHRAGIAVLAVEALREAALPVFVLAVAALVGGGLDGGAIGRALVLAGAGAVVAAIAGMITWSTTTWSIHSEIVRLRTGVVSTKVTDIPLARVQAVDTVRGPVQRLFGVQGVHLQTAGGGKEGEIVLAAVSAAEVDELRAAVRARHADIATPADEGAARRLGSAGLLLAAITSGQLGVLLPLIAVVPQLGDELLGGDLDDAGRSGARLVPDETGEWVLAAAALLGTAWFLAILGTVVTFAGFRVARDGDRLRVARGLLARRDATIPVARVQAVLVVEGLLRRPLGLAALRVEVAGYAAEAAAAQTLFPLVRRREVAGFLAALLPELADGIDGLAGPPPRAWRGYLLPPALAGLAIGVLAWAAVPAAGPWPLLLALPGAGFGQFRRRAAGWRLHEGRLAMRSRRLARVTVLAPTARLQQHSLRQSLLQRRGRLADVELRVGAGTRSRVRHLDADAAAQLYAALGGPGRKVGA